MPFRAPRRGTSRRLFLSGLGASALVAPFALRREASAEDGIHPRRLILVFSPHGCIADTWNPVGSGTDFTLGEALAELEPYKSDNLIVLRGLRLHGEGGGGPHTRGSPLLWTGSEQVAGYEFQHGGGDPSLGWGWNASASVDQVIADRIVQDEPTPFRSLELGVHVGGSHPGSRTIYKGPEQPVDPWENPQDAFDAMFANLAVDELERERRRARGLSILDAVADDLTALVPRVPSQDAPKLEAHLDTIRELEKRLMAEYQCEAPVLDSPGYPENDPLSEDAHRHALLLAAAIGCGITRVGSLQLVRAENDGVHYFGSSDYHHNWSHKSTSSDAAARAHMLDIRKLYARRFKDVMDALAAIPEGTGTALDNTMIVWGSECADGYTHSFEQMPFVIGGGKNFLRTGRVLDYPDVAHHRLLVTILHAMGLTEYSHFGDNDQGVGEGPLAEVLA